MPQQRLANGPLLVFKSPTSIQDRPLPLESFNLSQPVLPTDMMSSLILLWPDGQTYPLTSYDRGRGNKSATVIKRLQSNIHLAWIGLVNDNPTQLVVLKLARGHQENRLLKHEYECYTNELVALQGRYVPFCYGMYSGTVDGIPLGCLVLEYCTPEQNQLAVQDEWNREVMLAICKIHEAGIEHNQLLTSEALCPSPPLNSSSPTSSTFSSSSFDTASPTCSTTSWASSTRTLVPTSPRYSCLANSPNSRSRSRSNAAMYNQPTPMPLTTPASTHIIPQGLSPRIIDFSYAKRRHICRSPPPADAYGRVLLQDGRQTCPELAQIELLAFDVMGMTRPIMPPATRFDNVGSTLRWL